MEASGRVVTVVGNRPQFVKAAAVSSHLRELVPETLVHSGQHYDRELSAVFFEELELPRPDHELAVGSGSHAGQTAAIMTALEPLLEAEHPAAVLVYGDTNTTLAAALVAAKMQIPLAHVEAGMRSFDMAMPEEVNRLVADRLADRLLCPTAVALENLEREGMGGRATLVGDVMADIAARIGALAERSSDICDRLSLETGGYLVATLHRAGNVDDPVALGSAVDLLLAAAAAHGPLVFPCHPRTRDRLERAGLLGAVESAGDVHLLEPLGYLDFACLVRRAGAVLTDSGGLQKEAYLAGVPCLTLREETEWLETLEDGRNRLVGLDTEAALGALEEIAGRDRPDPPGLAAYGDGRAGEACAREVAALATAAR